MDFVDHAVSADHTDQVDPADHANSISMFFSGPVVLIFRLLWLLVLAASLGIWVQAGRQASYAFAGNPVSSNKLT